jgi:hypothetical protein
MEFNFLLGIKVCFKLVVGGATIVMDLYNKQLKGENEKESDR